MKRSESCRIHRSSGESEQDPRRWMEPRRWRLLSEGVRRHSLIDFRLLIALFKLCVCGEAPPHTANLNFGELLCRHWVNKRHCI